MAYFEIKNVKVTGMSLCVPKNVESMSDYPLFSEAEVARMLPFFGLDKHRVASDDVCASDLCFEAAEKLLSEMNIDKDSIDMVVCVTPAPDYLFPATACVLHNRLGLKRDCAAFDVPFGCTGWVYGMAVAGNMMSSGTIKRALLLVGDTPSRAANKNDKSTYPFFGDGGSATVLEYEDGAYGIRAELGTIETGYDKIIMPHGGFRHPASLESHNVTEDLPGVNRSMLDTHMDGTDVFSLSTNQDPASIRTVLEKANIDIEDIDCFAFHQTNKFLMDRVVKKMKINPDKVPYSLTDFGNTSATAIPLTLITQRREQLVKDPMKIVACALGVGMSYGALYFETEGIYAPEMIEL